MGCGFDPHPEHQKGKRKSALGSDRQRLIQAIKIFYTSETKSNVTVIKFSLMKNSHDTFVRYIVQKLL